MIKVMSICLLGFAWDCGHWDELANSFMNHFRVSAEHPHIQNRRTLWIKNIEIYEVNLNFDSHHSIIKPRNIAVWHYEPSAKIVRLTGGNVSSLVLAVIAERRTKGHQGNAPGWGVTTIPDFCAKIPDHFILSLNDLWLNRCAFNCQIGPHLGLAYASGFFSHILGGPKGSQQKVSCENCGKSHNPLSSRIVHIDNSTNQPPTAFLWAFLLAAIGITCGLAEIVWRYTKKYRGEDQGRR